MKKKMLGRRRSGMTYIEILVAATICVLCLSVMIQLWAFTMFYTVQTGDNAIACNLARQTLETLKETGFSQTTEYPVASPLVHYFDINTNNMDSTPTTARYKVSTSVVSDLTQSGVTPTAPATNALRLVTITVTLVSTGATLTTFTTYFARDGI